MRNQWNAGKARKREKTMETSPARVPGGGWEGVPKPRGLFCNYPADTGARRKYGGGGEDGASSMEDARINTSEETVSMQDGGQRGVPGDSNRRDGEVGPRCAAQHGTI